MQDKFFAKKRVSIFCCDKIIYIASSITECAKIFRKDFKVIRDVIQNKEHIFEYSLRYAKETDTVDTASAEEQSSAIQTFRQRLKDYDENKKAVNVILHSKKKVKSKKSLRKSKEEHRNDISGRLTMLRTIWTQKFLRTPSKEEDYIFQGLSKLSSVEFYVKMLQTHIESHYGVLISEQYIKRVLNQLSPVIRKKENKAKNKKLTIDLYYFLNQDVAVISHRLRSAQTQTIFLPHSEFKHITDKIQEKYGVDIIGCEFNIFLSD